MHLTDAFVMSNMACLKSTENGKEVNGLFLMGWHTFKITVGAVCKVEVIKF